MRTQALVRYLVALVLLSSSVAALAAQPRLPRPATGPSTQPSSQPSVAVQRQRLMTLSRQAIQHIEAGRLDAAEKALTEALGIEAHSPVNLYNMACVKALKGRPQAAMEYLERAALEGFTDFGHIERDSDLSSLRERPEFKRFLGRKAEFQRRAADRVIDWLKREFGEGYIYEIDQANKLIFATNTDRQTLESLRKRLARQAASLRKQVFSNAPDQYITVALPSPEDYRKIVPNPSIGGFYNDENRILIAQRMGQVMTHEFTHALHFADMEPQGQEHPIWLAEGFASLYEAGRFDGEDLVPDDNYRLAFIQLAGRRNQLIPLDRLLKMDQRSFVRTATNAYGQAGSLLLYLHEKKLLRKFYETYKAGYDQDRTGRVALQVVTGMPLAQIESEWKAWMLRRTPPPASTGRDGPILGIRFMQGHDGLQVESLIEFGPAWAKGIRAGDIVIGIDDHDVRDMQSLVPVLAERRVGDEVVLSLRREGKYLHIPVRLAARNAQFTAPATAPAK